MSNDHPLRIAADRLDAEFRPLANQWLDRFSQLDNAATPEADAASIMRLVIASDYAAHALLREWDWFCKTAASEDTAPSSDFDDLEKLLAAASDRATDLAAMMRRLRRFRHRHMLHILWQALDSTTPLTETMHSLSGLADALIRAASIFAGETVRQKYGEVAGDDDNPAQLITLAMGKLGGFELNFSSDVDLIFIYPSDGESDGPRSISAQEYFTRQTRLLVSLLDDVTEDGFVFRVDTRLRPFGDSGPPVVSLAALESYLVQHGRGWERYAYVKARVVGDMRDRSSDESIANLIQPFVYRRYLDYGVFESLRDMKSLIRAEVRKRDLADNIKLGPGGIREIEFIVQSLQLVRGGNDPELRTTELLKALPCLVASRCLDETVVATLSGAYEFLRRLENFIQALRDQQTHELPTDELDRARVAMAMGYSDWAALSEDVSRHRRAVVAEFETVAFRSEGRDPPDGLRDEALVLWRASAGRDEWRGLLGEYEFPDAAELADILADFRADPAITQIGKVSANRLSVFVAGLLQPLRELPRPVPALNRILKIAHRILRRSAYLALMNENPIVLRRLLDLCGESAYLAREVERYPALLDEMLDPGLWLETVSENEMLADLEQRRTRTASFDSEQRVEELARFQRASLFRIALADFGGALTIMKVSDRLTQLAEIVLQEALRIAWDDLTPEYGFPVCRDGSSVRKAGFSIAGYGKLGGLELSYRSDLDIVFLHDSAGDVQRTDGAKQVENSVFFGRLVSRLVHFLTTQTGSGVLYEVDTRLRPSGRSGLLVTSVEAFERYQRQSAWTWEHQALLRGRPVAGDDSVGGEFRRVRAEVLGRVQDAAILRKDVSNMRNKMRSRLDKSDTDSFDLKQGRGGITDIEFLVQFLVLKNAAAEPDLIHYSDNIRQLDALASAGYVSRAIAQDLQDAYRAYRLRLHRLALDELLPVVHDDEFRDERELVATLWESWIDAE